MVQRPAPGLLGEDRQTRTAGCVWVNGPGNDRLADHDCSTRGKNVWFVGILDERLDDFNRACSRYRSMAQTASNCPASSMRSSPWPAEGR